MHLVDDLVGGVGERFHVVVDLNPGPGAGPGVAFDEDVLGCGSCGADAVDGGLVEVENEGLVHVVIFVVWYVSVLMLRALIGGRGIILVSKTTSSLSAKALARVVQNALKSSVDSMMLPKLLLISLEHVQFSNGRDLLSSVIMRINDGVSALAGNKFNGLKHVSIVYLKPSVIPLTSRRSPR